MVLENYKNDKNQQKSFKYNKNRISMLDKIKKVCIISHCEYGCTILTKRNTK